MNITKEIIDYNKHKIDIDKWINIKGEIKYLEFAKILKDINCECTWKNVSNLYRYDKRLQINIFKYMSFFEEYIRAKLWNENIYKDYKDLNKKTMNELIDYIYKNSNIIEKYFSCIEKNKLLNVKELRNTISHNDIVIKCKKDQNDYKHIILDFYSVIPAEYKDGFKKDIYNCQKKLSIDKKLLVVFKNNLN